MSERIRLRQPPSSVTGELGQWCQELWRAVNSIPTISYFSGTHPNTSGITGLGGHILINVSPASNVSRMFINTGTGSLPNKNSWTSVG